LNQSYEELGPTLEAFQKGHLVFGIAPAFAFSCAKCFFKPSVLCVKNAGVKHALKILKPVVMV
jgi:hypothetical protein